MHLESNIKQNPALVLPHKFYVHNKKHSGFPAKKDLSCQTTKSFSQRLDDTKVKSNEEKTSTSKSKRDKVVFKYSLCDRRGLKCACTQVNEQDISSPKVVQMTTKDGNQEIVGPQLVHLFSEINAILNSNKFMNQIQEEQMIEKVCLDHKDVRWESYYSTFVIPSILESGKKIRLLYEKYEKVEMNRMKLLCKRSFIGWKNGTICFMKREIVQRVDNMDINYYCRKKRNVLRALSAISLGASSKKKILQRRRDGLSNARSRLTTILTGKQQSKGIITNEMVQLELRRIFHSEMCNWNRKRYLADCFANWKDDFDMAKGLNQKANQHLKGKLFKFWRGWTLLQVELISASTPTYRIFELETFQKKWCLVKPFIAWRTKTRIYIKAKQMRRQLISRFVEHQFDEWQTFVKKSREIKTCVLQKWKDYKFITIGKPFLSWRDYAVHLKHLRQYRDSFVSSYSRMKKRRMLGKLFRTWRHQSRYGRVTSMYSRQELIQKLAAQSRKIDCFESKLKASI